MIEYAGHGQDVSTRNWARDEGSPLPLGATWIAEEGAYNFALYSKHAERVTLLAFRADELTRPVFRVALDYLRHKSGRVWHCRVSHAALGGARYYAYSIAGPPPAGRFAWHAFDPDTLLLDPYAETVFFPSEFNRVSPTTRGPNPARGPLGVIPLAAEPGAADRSSPITAPRPRMHESDAVIYELHVRNFTRHPSAGVTPGARGTFRGIVERIPYLVDLGVTAVELMPVFQGDPSAADCWGYMPLSFFALNAAYASGTDPGVVEAEFRDMVDGLHRAGIEVILDVVYNHTCEGDSSGPVYSYKGIDNSTYYLMTGDAREPYANYTGTGNTLNCANHAVRKMILDSMRRWVRRGVDGFRFDLASIYTRGVDGAIRYDDPPFLGEISADPELASVRLIAEPWDAGASQLGRRFPGLSWQQWNGAFRDDVRRFVRGDDGMVPALMRRLYGSDDLFPDDRLHAYRPPQSVNYVTSHDGPTLYDLVSYNQKCNWANGHENRDGPPENFSWNCGWEGDSGVPADVARLRVRQAKTFVALLVLANGTPMLRAGDEFLATQRGNDNPYNRDDETTWLDWERAREHAGMVRFTKLAIAFRKAHLSLCRSRFWRDDVRWYGTGPSPDLSAESRAIAYCLHGTSQGDADIYVMINASPAALEFALQEHAASEWRCVIDTARESPDDIREAGDERPLASSRCIVSGRSIVALVAPSRSPRDG